MYSRLKFSSRYLLLGILFIPQFSLAQVVDDSVDQIDCAVLTYNLKLGSKDSLTGGDVTTLQIYLSQVNYLDSDPTGYFGRATLQAVKDFQKANGISPIGSVGSYTRAKIKELSCSKSSDSGSVPSSQTTQPTTSSRDSSGVLPSIVFSASKTDLIVDEKFRLSWIVSNAQACYLTTEGINGKKETVTVPTFSDQDALSFDKQLLYLFGKNPKLSLVCKNKNGESQKSIYFNITSPNTDSSPDSSTKKLPIITVISQNLPTYLYKGDKTTVFWKSENVPSYAKFLVRLRNIETDQEYDLATSDNDGYETFEMLRSLPTGGYKVELKISLDSGSYLGISDSYIKLIDGTSSQTSTPAENSTSVELNILTSVPEAQLGEQYFVKWSTVNAVYCYSPDNSISDPYGTQNKTSGSIAFISNTVGKAKYTLTCKSSTGQSTTKSLEINVISPTNTVTSGSSAGSSAGIYILTPNSGEYWYRGEGVRIEWKTTVPASDNMVTIRLISTDGGKEYNIGNTFNDGSEKILIPSDIPNGAYYIEMKMSLNGVSYSTISPFYIKVLDRSSAEPGVLGAQISVFQCTNLSNNLHRGSELSEVISLQNFLIKKGLLSESATGFYGDKTVEAVKKYQESMGIKDSGMVYEYTREAIKGETCR